MEWHVKTDIFHNAWLVTRQAAESEQTAVLQHMKHHRARFPLQPKTIEAMEIERGKPSGYHEVVL